MGRKHIKTDPIKPISSFTSPPRRPPELGVVVGGEYDRDTETRPFFLIIVILHKHTDSSTHEKQWFQSIFFRNRRAEIRPKLRLLPTDNPSRYFFLSQLLEKLQWKSFRPGASVYDNLALKVSG